MAISTNSLNSLVGMKDCQHGSLYAATINSMGVVVLMMATRFTRRLQRSRRYENKPYRRPAWLF
jgi:hypothetical protein